MSRTRDVAALELADPAVIETFKAKLRWQLKRRQWTNVMLANAAHVSPTAAGKWVNTGVIGKKNLATLADIFGVSVVYFLNPDIPVETPEADDVLLVTSPAGRTSEAIQVRDIYVATDSPALVPGTAGPIVSVLLQKQWVDFTFPSLTSYSQLCLMTVANDSMAETLNRGDVVFVDVGVQAISEDGLYLLRIRGRDDVRRVQNTPDGGWLILCDNARYEKFTVLPGRDSELPTVVGKVLSPISLRTI